MKWVGLFLLYRGGSEVQEGQVTRAGSQLASGEHGTYQGACGTSKLSVTACNTSDTSAPHSLSWGGVWAVGRGGGIPWGATKRVLILWAVSY